MTDFMNFHQRRTIRLWSGKDFVTEAGMADTQNTR